MLYLANAFSLSMLPRGRAIVAVQDLDGPEFLEDLESAISVVGHVDTAAIFSIELAIPVAVNRASVTLNVGDRMLVGQYQGPRLAEGTTRLPEGASIRWMLVTVTAPVDLSDAAGWASRIDEGMVPYGAAVEALNTAGVPWQDDAHRRNCAVEEFDRITRPGSTEKRTWMADYVPSELTLRVDPNARPGTPETERAGLALLAEKAGIEYHGESLADLRTRRRS